MMVHRVIGRVIQAGRRPSPASAINADMLPRRPPSAALAIGSSVDAAIAGLNLDLGPRTLLVPDQRNLGSPGPRLVYAITLALARSGAVTIGLPQTLEATKLRRWNALASAAGATVTMFGAEGWMRVQFGNRSQVLETGDFPATLYGEMTVVALSVPAGAGTISQWTEIVHPNTSLRSRVTGHAVAELSMAVDARYLIAGQVGTLWLASLASPAIVAELVARGIERLTERLHGIETIGPWEDAGIQHLAEIGDCGTAAANLVLDVWLEDTEADRMARRLAEMLGWRLRFAAGLEGTAQ